MKTSHLQLYRKPDKLPIGFVTSYLAVYGKVRSVSVEKKINIIKDFQRHEMNKVITNTMSWEKYGTRPINIITYGTNTDN